MELQQSPQYKKYILSLGWTVEELDGVRIFIKKLPVIGTLAKIQRPLTLPYLPKLIPLLKKYHVCLIAPEPDSTVDQNEYSLWLNGLSKFFRINTSPFLPTKTIMVDMTADEKTIFARFTEAKRRAVRKAVKNGVTVRASQNIQDLIAIKSTSAGMFGFITTTWADTMWDNFSPENATILLAVYKNTVVGGVLLIFYDKTAYYWIAGATHTGKKVFAPTLLVWEALKTAKKYGCTQFDFIGVWDERMPGENLSWKGFTKFKEGFGGKELYYPIATPRR